MRRGAHSVALICESGPRCVGVARAELRKELARWGIEGIEDSAVLILSELLTNAVRHGAERGTVLVRIHRWFGRLRIEAHDTSAGRPQLRNSGPDETSGRGLVIVEATADRWGVDDGGDTGKIVWAELLTEPEHASAPVVVDEARRARAAGF
ncbi:ATP-binding protein [Streptomyces katsurahamanus]|uniref:ATP-binding protein n=1 Tax=Streptomyces katsurahamanus TaxID=2577098 RepID=A0ABW9NZN0_9ACTN|nr:ATP-binding protein [Streptomyces katsurahamanus]